MDASPPSPLRNGLFRNLWLASLASGVGTTMHDTAAAWTLAVDGAPPQIVALYQTMSSLPLFLFALPAGAVADLTDRRRLVLHTHIVGALLAALLAAVTALGLVSPAWLLGTAFALGLVFAFSNPAWMSLMPEIITREQMPAAVTLGAVGVNVARSLGPVAAGLLLAAAGPAWVFGVNAASYLLLAGMLLAWRRASPPRPAHSEHFFGAMAAAVRFTRHSPAYRAALLRGAVFVGCAIAAPALLPVVARAQGFGAATFGGLMGAYGLGAIFTALVALPWLRRRCGMDALLGAFTVLSAVSLAGLAFAPHLAVTIASLVGAGAAWVGCFATFNVATQAILPNWVRARGSAIQLLVMQASIAVAALGWGALAARGGVTLALAVAAGAVLAGLVLVPFFRLHRVAALDTSPSDHWLPHAFSTEPADDAGPVLVTVEYRVAPEKADAFRAAMDELRRVRLRDGGFRWSLWQDLAAPEHFGESFVVATWGEHQRQHTRATQDDRRIEEAALAFHLGPEPPRISHFLAARPGPAIAAPVAATAALTSHRSV